MQRWVAAVLVVAALFGAAACSDDTRPAGPSSNGRAVSSGSDLALAQSMARTLADGLQQGASGRITPEQAECVVNEIVARVPVDDLASIASEDPDPGDVSSNVRRSLADAFDKCLPSDVANELTKRLGL
jgi:hypothetical protein